MKPENIKKVWEHYRGFQIRYRIGRSQYIIDAFNKNMNGDFSPSLFINPIESKVHLIVKEYIKCLLEQEALEQAQQEQTTIDTQQKSPTETEPQEQSTPTIDKAHNSPPIPQKGGVPRRGEVVKKQSQNFCAFPWFQRENNMSFCSSVPKNFCEFQRIFRVRTTCSFCHSVQNKDTRVRKNFNCTLSHTFSIFAL